MHIRLRWNNEPNAAQSVETIKIAHNPYDWHGQEPPSARATFLNEPLSYCPIIAYVNFNQFPPSKSAHAPISNPRYIVTEIHFFDKILQFLSKYDVTAQFYNRSMNNC